MAGSTFGDLFRITTFGESHGKAIGVIVDGCPAGLDLSEAIIQPYLDRRRPGVQSYTTARKESDTAKILSGVFEGKSTGTPIAIILENEDQRSRDYGNIAELFRPGHADLTFDSKYGFRDYRGGGRSSGRETAARVAGGAVALEFLKTLGIEVKAAVTMIGGVPAAEAEDVLAAAAARGDSLGGIIECRVTGMPAGVGETVFDKLDALLSQAIMSIGAVKGIEFGEGFGASRLSGSNNNDPMRMKDGQIEFLSHHAGGILGGMSSGDEIVFRAAFKPTPSISSVQQTVTRSGEDTDLVIKGRHDVCILPRAVVVVEAMTGLVLADLLLRNMTARVDNVKRFYQP
ncbi:MAG: chorismate synthase [Lachnospiraceae bacterium]|nr:chorismate synthase [Lachnospiraceae bacterium]